MNHKATALLPVWLVVFGCSSPVGIEPRPVELPEPAVRHPAAAMFGRFDDEGRFMRLTELRLVDGRVFGWRIRLPCHGPIEFTETMTLPAPGDWTQIHEQRKTNPSYMRATSIRADGKQTVTHDYAACVDGWIEHSWTIAHEDPAGEWIIDVAIPRYAPVSWRVQIRR